MLTLIIFFPAIGAMLGFLIEERSIKFYGVSIAFIELILALFAWFRADFGAYEFELMSQSALLPTLGISYLVGVDAISLSLIVMSAFMSLVALFALSVKENLKHLVISVLFLEMTMMGVFASLDMIMFYLFWELSLLPMLYIIGAWGSGKRIYAAVKFFIYTFLGSVFMLIGIIFMAYLNFKSSGAWSFSLLDWYGLSLSKEVQIWLFVAFAFAFAVKTPMFPFHTWLPYAHGQAPTIGSVLLAAVLLKMGTYGFVRLCLPLFADASVQLYGVLCTLGAIMVVYTALIAYAQDDMKQVIAYSSISHMGIIILGIFSLNSIGIAGAIFLMISHGIVSGALFLLVGMIYDRRHTKLIAEFGGLAHVMPRFALIFGVILLGSIGLPLTIGFVGEFLSLLGIFKTNAMFAFFGGIGIIVGAIYMLSLYRRVFFGECKNERNLALKDLNFKELVAIVPLCLLVIALGVYPNFLLKPIDISTQNIISKMQKRAVLQDNKDKILRLNSARSER
ncbi:MULTISPECIES: NADH-quinone oxidoreductase subunit M [Campylobacter]|uniref:NADH-quinone oxidoreductase subunit M n=1 Tax=Campylobacter TaxID=194 RepID=UPI001470631B|nr:MULTISPECIES: NADH-quinone oxidoreductase subunit M [Campylobacter]MBN7288115.1 NADH-quinone oxidoreductase subunit M [Campylobacter curvus]MDU6828359.1 NADH-quinone oxidoreductase subunit M [Campylobacter sp.]